MDGKVVGALARMVAISKAGGGSVFWLNAASDSNSAQSRGAGVRIRPNLLCHMTRRERKS
jgi:hypothetical protein